jgi:hypothetical protein
MRRTLSVRGAGVLAVLVLIAIFVIKLSMLNDGQILNPFQGRDKLTGIH